MFPPAVFNGLYLQDFVHWCYFKSFHIACVRWYILMQNFNFTSDTVSNSWEINIVLCFTWCDLRRDTKQIFFVGTLNYTSLISNDNVWFFFPFPYSGWKLGGVERVVCMQPRMRAFESSGMYRTASSKWRKILRGLESRVRELHRRALHSRWVSVCTEVDLGVMA